MWVTVCANVAKFWLELNYHCKVSTNICHVVWAGVALIWLTILRCSSSRQRKSFSLLACARKNLSLAGSTGYSPPSHQLDSWTLSLFVGGGAHLNSRAPTKSAITYIICNLDVGYRNRHPQPLYLSSPSLPCQLPSNFIPFIPNPRSLALRCVFCKWIQITGSQPNWIVWVCKSAYRHD